MKRGVNDNGKTSAAERGDAMPVIGRLDGQVEEVIIKPVGRRHAPGERDSPEAAPALPAPPRGEPQETRHADRPETSGGVRRDDGELPVWLL